MGETAARHIAGDPTPLSEVPFTWGNVMGKEWQFAGIVTEEVFCTDDGTTFWYVEDDQIKGVLAVGEQPLAVLTQVCLSKGVMPSPDEIKANQDVHKLLRNSLKKAIAAGCSSGDCCQNK